MSLSSDTLSKKSESGEALSKKVDDLETIVERLSKSFDDYMVSQQTVVPPPKYEERRTSAHAASVAPNIDATRGTAREYQGDEFTTDFSKDENEERGNWSGRLDFFLACLGCAVGLGNVWRFPYLCYKNGGAVFFIPYVIMLVFVGIPIFFLELSLGQFTSSSPLTCWEMAKAFKGIGFAMVIVSCLVSIYYNVIISWSFFYLFASFRKTPPWKSCDRDWADDWCEDYLLTERNNNFTMTHCEEDGYYAADDGVCYNLTGMKENVYGKMVNNTPIGIFNQTRASEFSLKPVLATEQYLNGYVIGSSYSGQFEDMGDVRWQLVLCLLLSWIIVVFSLIKGVKSSGKVVYFTAIFPYLVLIILLIRGVLLDGHRDGVEYYIAKLDIDKLKDAEVWKDAAVQIFFSLSASFGGLLTLSSYNRFHNDCLRDALVVSISNCLTSFFAGFVIFSYIGFLAHERGLDIEEVAEGGSTLAFVIYPAAVIEMPGSTVWAILFFIMLITLGLDSEFALVETVTTCIMDQFPSLRKKKALVIIGTAAVLFLLGLTMTTDGGVYMLEIMDLYSGGWNVLLIAFCECFCIAYVYGFFRFRKDIDIMIARSCSGAGFNSGCYWYWGVMWYFFTPTGVLFVMIFSWVDYSRPTFGSSYTYPRSAEALGWLMTLAVVCGLVVTPIVLAIIQCRRGEDVMELFRPSRYWGPALPKHRRLMGRYLRAEKFEIDPWADSIPVFPQRLQSVETRKGHENPDYLQDKTSF